jgi:ABC-2 type transport system ATP-binding protein
VHEPITSPTAAKSGEVAISAHNIVKNFRPHGQATSLKERLLRGDRIPRKPFRALDNISIDIPAGHTVGLIGHNGSGKSTLLKVLSGIIRPTTGEVVVNGRVASLLELGAGFNGELTGRENIYLNASLLGLTRNDIDEMYDSIVGFAELGEFIDDPVKHYSSGMYVRLGFAVAVHVDPDILLIDEVLAVGDEAFQAKCLDKIEQFQQEGRTILVVSHALDLVARVCDRAIVLDHGSLVFDGDPIIAADTLRMLLGTTPDDEIAAVAPPDDSNPVQIVSAVPLAGIGGPEITAAYAGQPLVVRVTIDIAADAAARCAEVIIVLMGVGDIPILIQSHHGGPGPLPGGGRWVVDFRTDELPPARGAAVIAVQVNDPDGAPIAVFRAKRGFALVRDTVEDGLIYAPYTTAARIQARPAISAEPIR